MADRRRIQVTLQMISEIAQKHSEQLELIAEARRLLANTRPDTFLGRRLRTTAADFATAETSASPVPPSWVDSGPVEI